MDTHRVVFNSHEEAADAWLGGDSPVGAPHYRDHTGPTSGVTIQRGDLGLRRRCVAGQRRGPDHRVGPRTADVLLVGNTIAEGRRLFRGTSGGHCPVPRCHVHSALLHGDGPVANDQH